MAVPVSGPAAQAGQFIMHLAPVVLCGRGEVQQDAVGLAYVIEVQAVRSLLVLQHDLVNRTLCQLPQEHLRGGESSVAGRAREEDGAMALQEVACCAEPGWVDKTLPEPLKFVDVLLSGAPSF